MKKIKKELSLLLVMMMVLSMAVFTAGCGKTTADEPAAGGEESSSSEYEKMTIKVGGTVPETHPITKAQFLFKEIVERESDGAMKVEVYPSGQL